jgi:UrcA family protein
MKAHHLMAGAAIALAFAGLAAPAAAGSDARQALVSARGVDFAAEGETQALLARLDAAAARVCRWSGSLKLREHQDYRACRTAALERAVARLDQPTLTALHRGRSAAFAVAASGATSLR